MKTFLVRAGGYGGGIGDVVYTENGSSGEREYFLYNAIGSTSALTDDSGSVISTTNYGAWGAETGTTGSSENVRKFSTKERSASIGLDYFGFRYYDYDLGRFTTRDPSGYPDGPNNYLYCDNNPVNKIDALGLYSWWDDVIGTATEFSKMAWQGTKEVASIIGEGSAAVVTGKSSVKDLAAGIGKNVVDKIDGVIEKNANRISAQVEGGSSWAGATVATAGAMVGDVMGYTPLLEGAHGTDLASGQQLSEVDRASRMLTGGGQLILSGIAVGKTYDPNASFSVALRQIAEKQAPQPSAGEKVLTQIEKNVKPENISGRNVTDSSDEIFAGSKSRTILDVRTGTIDGSVGNFDQARRQAFKNAGMTDASKVEFTKYDEATGTVVEFGGAKGSKVGYDGPHSSPGLYHDRQHISWQSKGKRKDGEMKRGNIPYEGEQHPHRSKIKK